jgi:acetylornithine deacetylase/succinyl-diaminopimelate desuccinylase-like protein
MPTTAHDLLHALDDFRARREAALLREFRELLSLRNIAGEPGHMRENAAWLRSAFERRGLATRTSHAPHDPDAPPAVIATLDAGAYRTVGVYAHYDGQPADDAHWTVAPWRPTLFSDRIDRGGVRLDDASLDHPLPDDCRIYARSTADDKAPIIALLAALDALRDAGVNPAVNLVVFIEGEEETTSPNLAGHIERNRDLLAAPDVWLFCDGPADTFGRRHVAFGVRGDVELELAVWGPPHELHSGHFGNFALNPAAELARLLGAMHDDAGRILVPGFDDDADEYSAAELNAVHEADGLNHELREHFDLPAPAPGDDDEPYFARMLRPSLNIRGLEAAGVREHARNVIPRVARASIDLRTVRGSDPARLVQCLRQFARDRGFTVLDREPTAAERRAHARLLTLDELDSYPAVRTDMTDPAAAWALNAVERASGERVLRIPTLGSSMPMHAFAEGVRRPVLITPIANADNNQHAADENIRLGHLWHGVRMLASVLTHDALMTTNTVEP